MVGSTPLGADLAREVERTAADRPGIFGKSGAYGQVFALYTSASAAGVLVGPAWTSFAYADQGWTFLVISMGVLSASVAVPLVRASVPKYIPPLCFPMEKGFHHLIRVGVGLSCFLSSRKEKIKTETKRILLKSEPSCHAINWRIRPTDKVLTDLAPLDQQTSA